VVFGTDRATVGGRQRVYTSVDGVAWIDHGFTGGVDHYFRFLTPVVGNGNLVVVDDDGLVVTAADRNLDWVQSAQVTGISDKPLLQWEGGRFFLGTVKFEPGKGDLRFTSLDGVTWNPVTGGPEMPVVANEGIFAGRWGVTWSSDGVNWSPADSAGAEIDSYLMVPWGGGFFGYNRFGEAWQSEDGSRWEQVGAGLPNPGSTGVARDIKRLGAVLIAGGSLGTLVSSSDGGRSWTPSTVNGVPVPANWEIRHVKIGAGRAWALVRRGANEPDYFALSTADGRDWRFEPLFDDFDIVDLAFTQGESHALGADGTLIYSNDGWTTWEPRWVPGLTTGLGLVRYAGRWVVFGQTAGAGAAEGRAFSSVDGFTWANVAALPLNSSGSVVNERFYRLAHDRLIFGQPGVLPQVTENGVSWSPLAAWMPPNHVDIVERADGYLALTKGFGTSTMWTLPLSGGDWTPIDPYQPNVVHMETIDDRLFLFGEGSIREWVEADMILELAPLPPVTLGVGDVLSATPLLRNIGSEWLPEGSYAVDAWLSSNDFFGDANDVLIGRTTVFLEQVRAGGEVPLNLHYVLPGGLPLGESHLILQFDPAGELREFDRANNVAISRDPAVEVPQWRLDLVTTGDGIVQLDNPARFHPQGATVALTATAGKGTRFAGWSGDVSGGLDEVTILMDSDKTVEANFTVAVSLQIFVRGGGEVNGLVDDGIYGPGETASLTAVPAPGWHFAGWEGAVTSTDPALDFLLDESEALTATFVMSPGDWKALHFNPGELAEPAISGDWADPNANGIPNIHEYLHGTDPKAMGRDRVVSSKLDGGWLTLVYPRLETMPPGFGLTALGTRDLAAWDAAVVEERTLFVVDGVEMVEARLLVAGQSCGFVGVNYTVP
jgi:hypothetical protein